MTPKEGSLLGEKAPQETRSRLSAKPFPSNEAASITFPNIQRWRQRRKSMAKSLQSSKVIFGKNFLKKEYNTRTTSGIKVSKTSV